MIALVLMLAAAIGGLPRVYTPDTSVEGYTKGTSAEHPDADE